MTRIAGQLVLVGILTSTWGPPCSEPNSDGTAGATMTLPAAFPDPAARALAETGDSADPAPRARLTWRHFKPEYVSGSPWSTQACIVAPTVTLAQRTASGWQRVSSATIKRDVCACGSRNPYLLTVTGTVGARSIGYRAVLPKQKGLRTPVRYLFTVAAARSRLSGLGLRKRATRDAGQVRPVDRGLRRRLPSVAPDVWHSGRSLSVTFILLRARITSTIPLNF